MRLIDLTVEFKKLVRGCRGTIEFKARFWSWLDAQRREGPLRPLLRDMERHWSAVCTAFSLSEARDLLRQLTPGSYAERVERIERRFRRVAGDLPDVEVLLLAGLARPEGYSRFDRGRNTIYLGLDHPTALAHRDHLELILSHELCHAVRDPHPAVVNDYGGKPGMSHDDFVARHPFREHLVSESLATAISEVAYPGLPDRRYVYFDEEATRWCDEHRREIAERVLLALEREEPYYVFYSEGVVGSDSPDCCDYWFGLHLGRHALAAAPAAELLRMPSTQFLDRYLHEFVGRLAGEQAATAIAGVAPDRAAPRRRPPAPAEEPLTGASLPANVRAFYDEHAALLARRPALARRLELQLTDIVRRENLVHGDRPWDVHAYPLLLSADEERHLRWATDGLLRLIESVIERYREDAEVRAFFAFPRHVEELCRLEPGYRPHVMLGRFDSFWSGRRLRFLELNANGAALWRLAEVLSESALALPGLAALLERHGAQGRPLASRMLDGLLSAWRQARGSAEPRRIAIVDWKGIPTTPEQQQLALGFSGMGVPTAVVSPQELSFDGKELHGPEGPIDIVYRRLTTVDVMERAGEMEPLLAAVRTGGVVTVSSFGSDVAHSKRLFAFLTHERWQRELSPAERALIDAHVPWTRLFVPGKTQHDGRMRDLRELALAERERFVLKPAEGYEGRGVLPGCEAEPGEWEAEVERRFGGAHVLQEFVQAPLRRLLLPRQRGVEEVSRWLQLGQFVVGGQLAGFLARASEQIVLTADTDESVLPCLVVAGGEDFGDDQDFGPAAP